MKNYIFLSFSMLLFTGLIYAHSYLQNYFSGEKEFKIRQEMLTEQMRREKLKLQISEFKFREYQQEVALILPEQLKKKGLEKDTYPIRSLASVHLKIDLERVGISKAKQVFLKGKALFRKAQYEKAVEEFRKITDIYSFSVKVVESQFLMAESYFQLRKFDKAIAVIDGLVSQYPDHELTGFSMLRLGQIFEFQDRAEEAEGLYKTILQSFSNHDLQQQTKIALKAMKI